MDKHNGAKGRCWRIDDFEGLDIEAFRDEYEYITRKIRECSCTTCNGVLDSYLAEKKKRSAPIVLTFVGYVV